MFKPLSYLLLFFTFFSSAYADEVKNSLKSYLNNLSSVAIDFTQNDSHGNHASGKLLISRPYRFRCNYYQPFPLLIVGNKNYISIYDYDMEDLSRMKADESIFNFLVSDEIEFDRHFRIESVVDLSDTFELTLYHFASERRSKITFTKKTKTLKSLEILEDDNVITVTFNNIEQVRDFAKNLFIIQNPVIFGPPERMSKEKIEKTYSKPL